MRPLLARGTRTGRGAEVGRTRCAERTQDAHGVRRARGTRGAHGTHEVTHAGMSPGIVILFPGFSNTGIVIFQVFLKMESSFFFQVFKN